MIINQLQKLTTFLLRNNVCYVVTFLYLTYTYKTCTFVQKNALSLKIE